MLNDKTVFVTGGTGSFGNAFIKKVLEKYNPRKVIVYSRDELKQYEMQQVWLEKNPNAPINFFLGDVRDLSRLEMAMKGVDIVVHAAALKHVPATEYNPFEAVKTNIIGAQNIIDAALKNSVKRVLALSTDKAAAPVSLYGATKLTSDKLFITANNYRGKQNIKFSVVRYGNVFGSRGSVIPFFIKKKTTGIIPITDKRMTRFGITMNQGVNFVLNCISNMFGGELFVPKIPSFKIMDLYHAIAPECDYNIIGIRPGEKLHEEMITISDSINTIELKDSFIILPSIQFWSKSKLQDNINEKLKFCQDGFIYSSQNNEDFLTVGELKIIIDDYLRSTTKK